MKAPAPPPSLPPPRAGGKPSLLEVEGAASVDGPRTDRVQGVRMLDALPPRTPGLASLARRHSALMVVFGLAVIAMVAFWWWTASGRDLGAPGSSQTPRTEVIAETAPSQSSVPGAVPASVTDGPTGPANIERTTGAEARPARPEPPLAYRGAAPTQPASHATAAHELAAHEPSRPVQPRAETRPRATALATSPRTTPPVASARIATAPTRVAHPAAAAAAVGPQPSADPDVTLVGALLARISGERTPATPRPTIAQLVERCEAQSAKDSIEAFECRRRICAGYWGKAEACPMALAPKHE